MFKFKLVENMIYNLEEGKDYGDIVARVNKNGEIIFDLSFVAKNINLF